jgi:type VI secretion system ImpA/VasJ family protein
MPAGESLRYEPEYEAISAELAKIGTTGGGEVDWKAVANHSASLLERSKDLFLATALANALLQTQGLAGFKAGLEATRNLLVAWWGDLYPAKSRMRARASLFEWLSERTELYFADPAKSFDPAQVGACAAVAEELFAYCSPERMEGGDAGLGGLVRALRGAKDRSGSAGSAAAADGGASAAEAPAAVGTVAAPAAGAALSPAGLVATREEAFRRLAQLADFFTRAEPLSPVGPLLNRAVSWGKMSYKELYQELLANSREARGNLLDSLGIKRDEPKD